jgi:hypothetical protein
LIGLAAGAGLLRRNESDPMRELAVFTGGDPEGEGDDLSHHLRYQEAKGGVGPPLERFAERVYIAGVPPNTPDNLVAWIRDPPGIDPLTAMAVSGIGDAAARRVAAYPVHGWTETVPPRR